MGETSDAADFGDEADRCHKRHPAQGLERGDDRRPAPVRGERPELVGEARDARFGFVDRVAVFLQRDVRRRQRDTEIGEPPSIGLRPSRPARIAAPLPPQEPLQAMLGLCAYGPAKRPHKGFRASAVPCVLFIAFESPLDAVPVAGQSK